MEWAVLIFSATLLGISVIASFFKSNVDSTPAFYLFGSVSAFVFGATVIKKLK